MIGDNWHQRPMRGQFLYTEVLQPKGMSPRKFGALDSTGSLCASCSQDYAKAFLSQLERASPAFSGRRRSASEEPAGAISLGAF